MVGDCPKDETTCAGLASQSDHVSSTNWVRWQMLTCSSMFLPPVWTGPLVTPKGPLSGATDFLNFHVFHEWLQCQPCGCFQFCWNFQQHWCVQLWIAFLLEWPFNQLSWLWALPNINCPCVAPRLCGKCMWWHKLLHLALLLPLIPAFLTCHCSRLDESSEQLNGP